MKRYIVAAMAGFACAWSFMLATPALADNNSPFTFTVTPIVWLSTIGDGSAPTPKNFISDPAGAAPPTTDNLRWNYGLSYKINRHSSLSYAHNTFDFSLGRIFEA